MASELPEDAPQADVAQALRLDQQLCFMLYACSRAMTKVYQPMLKDLGVTYPQYLVMMVLWEWSSAEEPMPSVSALGERLVLDSGTLTPLLKRLEAQGLLQRERDPADDRRLLVAATPAGLALEARALVWVNMGAEVFSGDDAASMQDLRLQLQSLHKTLRSFQA